MDMTTHDMATLFAQLGLDNSPSAIKAFIASHKNSGRLVVSPGVLSGPMLRLVF